MGPGFFQQLYKPLALILVATFTAGCLFAVLAPKLWHWIVPVIHELTRP